MKRSNITFATILLVLACIAFSPTMQAAPPAKPGLNPPPDGGYPNHNTADGTNALFSLTTGFGNTAIGFEALLSNTTGNFNVATGHHALVSNTTGSLYVADGVGALFSNTIGNYNTATGGTALNFNTTGAFNTATGVEALFINTTGEGDTASGAISLFNNTNGNENTADGAGALNFNATGSDNTATGAEALVFNTTGNENTAAGFSALSNNTTGSNNTALGNNVGLNLTTGNNNIDIGNAGIAAEANTIRIGTAGTQTNAFIAGIRGVSTGNADAIPVLVDSAGQLGTASSSKRFKKDICPMDKASEAILAFRPVTFHYKNDAKGFSQFGLIAEEVAKVNPNLVVRDMNGEIYTVRFEAVNAMLLNEFLKEHRRVAEQEATIAQLKKEIETIVAHSKEQDSQIQTVRDQVQMNRTDTRVAAANP